MNDLEKHIKYWSNCKLCSLHKTASKHALYDTVPEGASIVDILFVGEGPGRGEDTLGKPFVGASGKRLRDCIEKAITYLHADKKPVYGFTNLVACRPCDSKNGPNRVPTKVEVSQCCARLMQIIMILNPRLIIAAGNEAHFTLRARGVPHGRITHPSYIIRHGHELDQSYIDSIFCEIKNVKSRLEVK